MKSLFVLLLLALALGAGYWKTQHPDADLETLKTEIRQGFARFGDGVAAVRDGGEVRREAATAAAAERQALLERVDELERTLQEAIPSEKTQAPAESAAQSDGAIALRVAELEQAVAETPARLDAIESRLDVLVQRLDESQDGAGDAGVAEVDERLDALRQQLDSALAEINSREQTVNRRLSTLDTARLRIDDRLDTLSGGQGVAASSAAQGAGGAQDDSTGNDNRSTGVDPSRLAALDGQLEETRASLEQFNQRFEDLGRRVGTLQEQLDSVQTNTESLSIDTLQADIREQLANLNSQMESADDTSSLDQVNQALETTRTRIQTLESRLQQLPTSSQAADEAQKTQGVLEQQVAELAQRLETLSTGADPELADTLSAVREQVNELSAREFVTREEFTAQKQGEAVEYKIYFDRDSTVVSDSAARVLDSFILQEQNRTTGVSIYGFTDRRGNADYNQALALRRARNVQSYLVQNGFDYTKIRAVTGFGEDAAAAVLPDESDSIEQRVVVLFADQP